MIYLPEDEEKAPAIYSLTCNKHDACILQRGTDVYYAARNAIKLSIFFRVFPGANLNTSGTRNLWNRVYRWNYYIRWCTCVDRDRADFFL